MGVLPGLPRQRSGWAGGLLSWGEGGDGGVGQCAVRKPGR